MGFHGARFDLGGFPGYKVGYGWVSRIPGNLKLTLLNSQMTRVLTQPGTMFCWSHLEGLLPYRGVGEGENDHHDAVQGQPYSRLFH